MNALTTLSQFKSALQCPGLLFLCLSFPGLSSSIELEESIQECIDLRFENNTSVLINQEVQLKSYCSNVKNSFNTSFISKFVFPEIGDISSLNQLLDVQSFLQSANYIDMNAPPVDKMILTRLVEKNHTQTDDQHKNLWEKFLYWLRSLIVDPDNNNQSWLSEWIDDIHFPSWLGTAIYFSSIGIVILLALAIVVYEVRQSKRKSKTTPKHITADMDTFTPETPGMVVSTIEQIRKLPLIRQPPALLQIILGFLMENNELPKKRSLTNREYTQYLELKHNDHSALFNQVAIHADQCVYGLSEPQSTDLEQLFAVTQSFVANKPKAE